jgi:segregation and condensation protein A
MLVLYNAARSIMNETIISTTFKATVKGEPVVAPQDLYIPPDALKVFLETFEGPLDLLLYLIKKQNIDILDIPIAKITHQYAEYINLMKTLQLELAAEYLVMAVMLAEIKSRLLLPEPTKPEDEDDPRAELIKRLQEYAIYKKMAEKIDKLPRLERHHFLVNIDQSSLQKITVLPEATLSELMAALCDLSEKIRLNERHQVKYEVLSIRERMSEILNNVESGKFTPFVKLFKLEEGRLGIVVTFMAILELLRQAIIEIVQAKPFAKIYVKKI